jgi:putative tryptophan/tyrosine transport system substrate-binding protein
MNRRKFASGLVGFAACIVSPVASYSQSRGSKIFRVGIIDNAPIWEIFRKALQVSGYIEGQNIIYDYQVAEGNPDRLALAAAELVRNSVDLIATFGTPAALAAKRATISIPIVAISVGDPVRSGLVTNLARPGGNVTGNTILGPDLSAKRLQLIKEVVPSISRVAFLWNPDNASNAAILYELQIAAPLLGIRLISVEARKSDDFDAAFAKIESEQAEPVLTTNDPLHQRNIRQIIDFTTRAQVPGIFQTRENVVAGGLISYGASFSELFRHGASYAQKILQGAKPEDLPVQQPAKFELVINLKTAKALGLRLPESFLLRADEVIE